MSFDDNINLLQQQLKQHGWTHSSSDEFFHYFQNHVGIGLNIPIMKGDINYPTMLELSLKKIKKLSPDISKLPLFTIIVSQNKNIRQKYNKVKNEWILSEPNSKYNLNEIPDIYIPKNNIFETKE